MNITMLSGLTFALALAGTATAFADVCKDIEAGGTVKIDKEEKTEGCTATLKKDAVVEGKDYGKISAGNHGVVIKLNGHKVTLKGLTIEYKGDFAVAVHGDNKGSDNVTFEDVTLVDTSSGDCKGAGGRVGAVLWKVKTANLSVTASDGKVRHGVVFGAPMPPGDDHIPPGEQGTATISGPVAHCEGAWIYSKKPILAFEREVTWSGGTVESVGPCDFEDPVLVNLRDHGLPGGPM